MGSKKNRVKRALQLAPAPASSPSHAVDDDLVDDLFTELDSRDKTVRQESATVLEEIQAQQAQHAAPPDKGGGGSRNRFKARQDSRCTRYEQPPPSRSTTIVDSPSATLRARIHKINPDGHCLFSAVADQLAILNVVAPQEAHYIFTRQAAAGYMLAHPQDLSHGAGSGDSGIIGPQEYARYCTSIRDTSVWGGEPEILALSRAYAIPIHVVQGGHPPVVVHDPSGAPKTDNLKEQRAVRISYHRRMFLIPLHQHYNSLRPRTGLQKITSPLKNLLVS
ncbi:hypothetical protein BC826DRAFT_1090005 [Russula brevipes]|nr:hypothetical protein BC826DRAFT_1090005 [Russula brevipes]